MAQEAAPVRLVDRLQDLVDRLSKIEVSNEYKHEMKSAIDGLRQDLQNVKVMAPHVFAPTSLR